MSSQSKLKLEGKRTNILKLVILNSAMFEKVRNHELVAILLRTLWTQRLGGTPY